MFKYIVFFALLVCCVFAADCDTTQPLSIALPASNDVITIVNVEDGYSVVFVNSPDTSNAASIDVKGGAKPTYNAATNTVTIGKPSSFPTSTTGSSSPSVRVAPMWILAVFGIVFSLQFPRSTVVVIFIALLALSQVQIGQAQCTKQVTITVGDDYMQNIRVGTTNTILCPSAYSRSNDGQCVSWLSTYTLLYSNEGSPSACSDILPKTAVLSANNNRIRVNQGSWFRYQNQLLSSVVGNSKMKSMLSLADGTNASFVMYAAATEGFNNFPVSITSGSTICNATQETASPLSLRTKLPTTGVTLGVMKIRNTTATNCSGPNIGPNCLENPNQTCPADYGCDAVCEQSTNGVTCGGCDSRVAGCGALACRCQCNSASPAFRLVPSLLFVLSSFAIMYLQMW